MNSSEEESRSLKLELRSGPDVISVSVYRLRLLDKQLKFHRLNMQLLNSLSDSV